MALRPIEPMTLPNITPSEVVVFRPEFLDIQPQSLRVDETYQRNLSDQSVALIKRIIAGWDWRAFKPPVCVRVDGALHVIDGQHTAIAAASHPAISTIPVMIVPSGERADRAMAFVKHNRDRIQVTRTQLHFALVEAGDEDAQTLQQVCERSGARILKHPPAYARFKIGETMAVALLQALVGRRHAQGARRVLECCVKANLAPISQTYLRAVEELLFGNDYAGTIEADDISTTLRELGGAAEKDAARFSAEHDVPLWRAMVVVLFRANKGARRGRK